MMNLILSRKNLYEMRDIEMIFTVMCSLTHTVFLYMQAHNVLHTLHAQKDSECN
jgi:hypothetical protein